MRQLRPELNKVWLCELRSFVFLTLVEASRCLRGSTLGFLHKILVKISVVEPELESKEPWLFAVAELEPYIK